MALWNSAPTGPTVYEFEPAGSLKAFQIVNNQVNSTILSEYTPDNSSVYVGLSLSANGGQNGIAWLVTGNQTLEGAPATLHALDATNLSRELWNSDLNGSRDQPGGLVKFATPTVVNGRVYVPTFRTPSRYTVRFLPRSPQLPLRRSPPSSIAPVTWRARCRPES